MSTPFILILLAALITISAMISATETALFSLRHWRVERLRQEHPATGRFIAEALKDPRVLVVSIIIGTELVNVGVSNLIAVLRRRYEGVHPGDEWSLAISVAITSALLVLICDLGPKSVAVTFPEAVAQRLAHPARVFIRLVRPLALPLARVTSFLTESRSARAAGAGPPAPLSQDDFRILVEAGSREGILKPGQAEMIEAAFRLGDLRVRQVMVPRPDIVALDEAATCQEALELIKKSRHSRIPVYRGGVDQITGVLYSKDLLASRFGFIPASSVAQLARPAIFVPEVMRARQMVRELQARKVHLAVVVDEYGATAGVVTLEDLLEEMVGEFSDEFDTPVRVFRRIKRGVFWVRASMALPEFSRRVRARIKDPEVDTLGGYVLKLFDRVPAEGDSVSDDRFNFTVRRMKGRRILVLLVQRREPAGHERKIA